MTLTEVMTKVMTTFITGYLPLTCVFVYFICVFIYLCICVFVYFFHLVIIAKSSRPVGMYCTVDIHVDAFLLKSMLKYCPSTIY